jgi:hypothetical protein
VSPTTQQPRSMEPGSCHKSLERKSLERKLVKPKKKEGEMLPVGFYNLIVRVLPEWFLLLLAFTAGVSYLLRAKYLNTILVPAWSLTVRGVIFLFLIVPFYALIWRNGMAMAQAIAMSRTMLFALFINSLITNAEIYRIYIRRR